MQTLPNCCSRSIRRSSSGIRAFSSSSSGSTVGVLQPCSQDSLAGLQQRPSRHRVTARVVQRDLTADLLENVAELALRTRLRESRVVKATISCDTWSLLSGRVNGVKIYGEGWRSPLNLTARTLEAAVGAVTIDPMAILLRQNIELTNVPVGTARVVFDATDFGHFLVHPLISEAVATAVQGHAFAFDQHSVRICAPSAAEPGGSVEFSGTWRGDNGRYRCRLLPVEAGASRGRGVQAHAVPLSIGGRASSASVVEDALSRFFSACRLNLQGAEMTFLSMAIIPGAGFAGGLADINLRLELRKFPPLHMQF